MKKCEDCEAQIDDKYVVCVSCLKKRNAENANVEKGKTNADLITALGQINNNLYALRTLAEYELGKKYKKKLAWDKDSKSFLIK